MNHTDCEPVPAPMRYELRYPPLFGNGCAFAFPCDAKGKVLMEQLSERARQNLQHARSTVGRELGWPQISARS